MNFQRLSPEDLVNRYKSENSLLKLENERLKKALQDTVIENKKILREKQALNSNFDLSLIKRLYYLTYTTSTLGSFQVKKIN
jgi:regulator of replication initiation timing